MDDKDFKQNFETKPKSELHIELSNFTFVFRAALIIALLINWVSENSMALTSRWVTLLIEFMVVYTIGGFLIEHFSRNSILISFVNVLTTFFDALMICIFILNYGDISKIELVLLLAVAMMAIARIESAIIFSLITGSIILVILWILTQKSYSTANFILVIVCAIIYIFIAIRFKLLLVSTYKKLEISSLTSGDAKRVADILYKLNNVSQKLNDVMITKDLFKIVFNDVPELVGTQDLGIVLFKDDVAEANFYSSKNDNVLSPIRINFSAELSYLNKQAKNHFVIRGENPILMEDILQNCPHSIFTLFKNSKYLFIIKFTYPQNIKGCIFFATPVIFERNIIQINTLLTKQIGIALSNSNLYQKANEEAASDVLTGLRTRRVMKNFLQSEIEYCNSNKKSFVILFIDIDNFKRFNDTFGHHIGDEVLKLLAREANLLVKPTDLVCRFGGEEFVIILHDSSSKDGKDISENLRHSIERIDLMRELSVDSKLTISLGGAVYPQDELDSNELVKKADWAMYRAKMAGKNRVYFFEDHKDSYVPTESGKNF